MLDELEKLVDTLLDGELTPDEQQRLSALLEDRENARRFVEINKLHYCLCRREPFSFAAPAVEGLAAELDARFEAAPSEGRSVLPQKHVDSSTAQAGIAGRSPRQHDRGARRARRVARPRAAAMAVAATVLAIAALVTWPTGEHLSNGPHRDQIAATTAANSELADAPAAKSPPAAFVGGYAARIVALSADVQWESESGPADFLMRLAAGDRLRLADGLVKLEFASRAVAVLAGPCDVELLGPSSVLLRSGKLAGRSEEGDFTVRTPHADVIDIGTAFGVAVGDARSTDVVVFEGEVDVRRAASREKPLRLTTGMSARIDRAGLSSSRSGESGAEFERDFRGRRPAALGANEVSFVDVVCGSSPGEYRIAGSIDPETGAWAALPWSEAKGVASKQVRGAVVPVAWNRWVEGVFLPVPQERLAVDADGGEVAAPAFSGGAWGPVWARRKIDRRVDPLAKQMDRDIEGFWGAGTTTALLDRSRWVRDGIVGLHANVGITVDLDAVRRGWGPQLGMFRGVVALLEPSHVSQPFHPDAMVSFQALVDGQPRYERHFCRRDGDAVFGVELDDDDRRLTLLVTDGNDGPVYDRLVLLDPVFEVADR